jgi:hypothetical protein
MQVILIVVFLVYSVCSSSIGEIPKEKVGIIPYNATYGWYQNLNNGGWSSNSVEAIEECSAIYTYLANGYVFVCMQLLNNQNQLVVDSTDGVLNMSVTIDPYNYSTKNFTCTVQSFKSTGLVFSILQEFVAGVTKPSPDAQVAASGAICDFINMMISKYR